MIANTKRLIFCLICKNTVPHCYNNDCELFMQMGLVYKKCTSLTSAFSFYLKLFNQLRFLRLKLIPSPKASLTS